jgi:hypothetical protein
MVFYRQRYPESVKIESQRSINRSSRAGASTEARWHSSGRYPGSCSRSEGGPGRQPVGVRQPVGGRAEPGVAGGPSCTGRVGWTASRARARLAREREKEPGDAGRMGRAGGWIGWASVAGEPGGTGRVGRASRPGDAGRVRRTARGVRAGRDVVGGPGRAG